MFLDSGGQAGINTMADLELEVTVYDRATNTFVILEPAALRGYILAVEQNKEGHGSDDVESGNVCCKLSQTQGVLDVNGPFEDELSDDDCRLLQSFGLPFTSHLNSTLFTVQASIDNMVTMIRQILGIAVGQHFTCPPWLRVNRPRNFAIRTVLKCWRLPSELIDLFFAFYRCEAISTLSGAVSMHQTSNSSVLERRVFPGITEFRVYLLEGRLARLKSASPVIVVKFAEITIGRFIQLCEPILDQTMSPAILVDIDTVAYSNQGDYSSVSVYFRAVDTTITDEDYTGVEDGGDIVDPDNPEQ